MDVANGTSVSNLLDVSDHGVPQSIRAHAFLVGTTSFGSPAVTDCYINHFVRDGMSQNRKDRLINEDKVTELQWTVQAVNGVAKAALVIEYF